MPKDKLFEKDIQNRFFDILIDQKSSFENTPINVYQKLVYGRYEEVLINSLPLFVKEVSASKFQKSIKEFMKKTPTTTFVWQIPNDYRKMTKKHKIFHKKAYLYELMYYDWIEIELYMKEYELGKHKKFSFKKSYSLSHSSRIKKFKYDLINGKFKDKRENFLIIYYDFKSDDIIYREINELIYVLLKRVNKKESISKTLKQLCIENEIDFKEAKSLLKEPLSELYLNRVLI